MLPTSVSTCTVIQCKSYIFIMDQNGILEETEGRNAVCELYFSLRSFMIICLCMEIRKNNGSSSELLSKVLAYFHHVDTICYLVS